MAIVLPRLRLSLEAIVVLLLYLTPPTLAALAVVRLVAPGERRAKMAG